MWLRSPGDVNIADNVLREDDIKKRKSLGWVEVPPMWIKHPLTGVVHLVEHPEHQKRLLTDGGKSVERPSDVHVSEDSHSEQRDQTNPTHPPTAKEVAEQREQALQREQSVVKDQKENAPQAK